MATNILLTVLTISFVISFYLSLTSAAVMNVASVSAFSTPVGSPLPSQDIQESISPTAQFQRILTNLGFHQLAMAIPSLSDSAFSIWNGPSTLFAPTDVSIQSCGSCSLPQLLREHMVPGIFSLDYLRKLSFGTKLETMSPGGCITVTSAAEDNTKIFIGGVEITHLDLYNNGVIVVHDPSYIHHHQRYPWLNQNHHQLWTSCSYKGTSIAELVTILALVGANITRSNFVKV
ncbi:uncharacterized protein LOC122069486 [Macadamia integrifolia]|uniref:uncharacterized protein LOC122069486 n=1 Tax=Macadamia integrifolia TaxID=60698 RepID=UPI001C4E36A5|nr:uncharacterized protein LOC122069486 [Macadamia integrifolia]